jgi:hypothetical protein
MCLSSGCDGALVVVAVWYEAAPRFLRVAGPSYNLLL